MPFDPTLGELSDQQSMTHGPEQSGPLKSFFDYARQPASPAPPFPGEEKINRAMTRQDPRYVPAQPPRQQNWQRWIEESLNFLPFGFIGMSGKQEIFNPPSPAVAKAARRIFLYMRDGWGTGGDPGMGPSPLLKRNIEIMQRGGPMAETVAQHMLNSFAEHPHENIGLLPPTIELTVQHDLRPGSPITPAITYNGKIYTGNSHLDAMDSAAKEHGIETHVLADRPGLGYGYESGGKFYHDTAYNTPWQKPGTQ